MLFLLTIAALAGSAHAHASSYCSANTFATNTTYMQFTKEPIPVEYGYQGNFKSIHCCVKGYRSIEWFKDGVPYPWSAGVSSFILYPEAANQTLYVRRASVSDAGNYSCRLSNDTTILSHTIRLQILEKPPDSPKIMYVSDNQFLKEGDPLRLYCEALVGRSYLADARSDLTWRRVWPNGTEDDLEPSQLQVKSIREDVDDIIGAAVSVARTAPRDYGKYVCVVHSNDFVSKRYVDVYDHYIPRLYMDVSWRGRPRGGEDVLWVVSRALLAAGVLAAAALAALLLHARCSPRLRLAAKQARAWAHDKRRADRGLDKEFDVLVCWTPVDGALVRGALLPTLTLKYKYRVLAVPLSTHPDNWYGELVSESGRCRSLVCVVSPTQHSASQLLTALQQLRALPLPPVIVLLQDVPTLKGEKGEKCDTSSVLAGLLRASRVLAWRHVRERGFWTKLRLSLPMPPNKTQVSAVESEAEDNKGSRCGSLTGLV